MLRRQTLGEDHPETARAMNQLAFLNWQQGRMDEAEPLYRKALEIGNRTLGPDDEATLAYEMNLATLFRSQGRYAEAESLYAHNLETKRRVLGAEDSNTLDTMGGLGNLLQESGRYEKAEAIHRQSLEIRRRVDGEKAPSTVSAMNNLANDLALLGRFEEAAPLMHETMQIKIELHGADRPSTLNSVSNLAGLYRELGPRRGGGEPCVGKRSSSHSRSRPEPSQDARIHGRLGDDALEPGALRGSRGPGEGRDRLEQRDSRRTASIHPGSPGHACPSAPRTPPSRRSRVDPAAESRDPRREKSWRR